MAARFHDFDAATTERDAGVNDPVVVKKFGQTWELPARMPAAVPLRVARWQAEGRDQDDLTEGETLTLAADIIPGEILNAWLAKGLDLDELGDIVGWVVQQYADRDNEAAEDAPGEATAPTEGAAAPSNSSSNDGPSSKPTSPASTESLSHVG